MRPSILFYYSFLIVGIFGCENPYKDSSSTIDQKVTNSYISEYAGGYTIEVDGVNSNKAVEAYALKPNGNATWMFIENNGAGGANVTSQKSGSWNADNGKITVSINGNSGLLKEEYVLKNGYFRNTQNTDRYLKKTE